MLQKELFIDGMSCNHCVMHVKKALQQVTGIKVIDVQIGKAKIEIDEQMVAVKQLSDAVQDAGYVLRSTQ
jgi:copper chaperone